MDEHSLGVLAVKINRSGMLDASSRLPIVTQITDQQINGSDWAFASFAPRFKELKVLQDVPEIEEVVGAAYANQVLLVDERDDEDKVKAVLRSLFTQLMGAGIEMVSDVLSKLISRLNTESKELKSVILAVAEIAEVVGAAYTNQVLLLMSKMMKRK